ncbi:MAG: SpoIIE family protein phosphatase [Thermoflexibacter sp.]|nr:SpoIIE family protein phosphatase [Thermoflexibacter sp.]
MNVFQKIITFAKEPKLLRQLLFWFLVIEFSAECVLMYVSYRSSESILNQEITNNLTAISARQAKQISDFLYEKENYVNVVANIPDIANTFETFEEVLIKKYDSLSYQKAEADCKATMQYFKESFGYNDIYLVDNEYNVLYATKQIFPVPTNLHKNDSLKNTELAKVVRRASVIMQAEISSFSYFQYSQNVVAFIASPIYKEKKMIGILVVEIDEKEIAKVVNNYTGLGKTGETILSTMIGNDAVFITDTRHALDAAFLKKIPLNSKNATAITNSVQGKKGNGFIIDYREKEAYAKWSYIPALRAGIVVKVDVEEAYAPIVRLRWILLSIILATLVIVIFAAYSVANSISKPITKLTKFAQKVSEGDLSGQISIDAKNEIGKLTHVFNQMTANLKLQTEELERQNDILEEKVRERTIEVEKQKEEIESQNAYLKEINVELEEKTEELHQQKSEIEGQRDYLEEINETLASKTEEIQEQKLILDELYDKLSKQNNNLISSINYAKRTQDALLPSHTYFAALFHDFFILNKPRDVVSGDFYWLHEFDDKIIIVVGDCTGHGVPGALMSMIGISLLNNIVIGDKIFSPDLILSHLNQSIIEALHQEESENRESIDCIVCTFDKHNNKLYYAGAMNSLLYMQNKELHEIKADKYSIGGYVHRKKYTLHEIDIHSSTILYLRSDGFQDQFGGLEGRKFMIKRLRELLSDISSLSLNSQKEILDNTLTNWMSDKHQQIDDVLILGLLLRL